MQHKGSGSRGLLLIGAFKLFKGLALLAMGIGALGLMHKDVAAELERLINFLRVDPDNYYIQKMLDKFSILDDRKLRELSVGTFFYSALLLTEGVGLMLRKRWAEYFTVIATCSFIPLEIYELVRRATGVRVVLLAINVAVVVYLVAEVRKNPHGPGEG
ncbi:MAG: DUF2127 domain-containing protein [Candidatus Acidiferrum sp.]